MELSNNERVCSCEEQQIELEANCDQNNTEQNRPMAILAYFSWLVLIPIFVAPKCKYVRFHANQGLVLAIVELGYGILSKILMNVFTAFSVKLGILVFTIMSLSGIAFLIMMIIGIVNAASGKVKELPTIGKIKILK